MSLAGQGAPVRQLQITLRPLQGLDRRLFVDTENNRLGRWIDIEADHIGGFRYELGVIALAPGFAGDKVDIVLAQEAPDILNVNVAQCLCQQRARPPGIAPRWRFIQKRQNALIRGLAVDRLLAHPRTVLQSPKAVVGKAPPPVADNPRLNAHFLGDGTSAVTVSRQQHYSQLGEKFWAKALLDDIPLVGRVITGWRPEALMMNYFTSSQSSIGCWSVNKFAQIADHQMSTIFLQLFGVAFACNPDHKPEIPSRPCLDSGDGILDDDRTCGLDPQ